MARNIRALLLLAAGAIILHRNTVALLLYVAVVVAYYAIQCAAKPLRKCLRCGGKGNRKRPLRRNRLVVCRRCGGSGQGVRVGRQLHSKVVTARRRAR